jgi:CheY-like chemotaxis protein
LEVLDSARGVGYDQETLVSDRLPLLLVEDDDDVRDAMIETLAEEGYPVVGVPDGPAGLAHLRSQPNTPLVLLDWNMAPMNGAAFLDEVAKEPGLAHVPIVLVTADSRVSDPGRARAGVEVLKKPVDLDELFALLARYMR